MTDIKNDSPLLGDISLSPASSGTGTATRAYIAGDLFVFNDMKEYLKLYPYEGERYFSKTESVHQGKKIITTKSIQCPGYPYSSRTTEFGGDFVIYFKNEADMIAFDSRNDKLHYQNICDRGKQLEKEIRMKNGEKS